MPKTQPRRSVRPRDTAYPVQGSNALSATSLEHSPYAFDEAELADIRAQYNPKATKARRELKKAQVGIDRARMAGIIVLLFAVIGSIGFLITREGKIAHNMLAIHAAKAELAEIERVNSTLSVRVEGIDPASIEREALGRLGMVRQPEEYHTITLPPLSGVTEDAAAASQPAEDAR